MKPRINYTKLVQAARSAIMNPEKHDLTRVQRDLGSFEYCIQTIRVQSSITPDVAALQEIIRLAALAIVLHVEKNNA